MLGGVGVVSGWGQGGVGERGFCKGKECHYPNPLKFRGCSQNDCRINAFFRLKSVSVMEIKWNSRENPYL